MSRPSFRVQCELENLEVREVLSAGGPSVQAQYMLELINQARTNPAAAAEKVTTNLTKDAQTTLDHYGIDPNNARNDIASAAPRSPLAWSDQLASAAQGQSQDQANMGRQSHTGSDGSNLDTRLDRVGYGDRTVSAENAYAYANSVDQAMQAFLIDWGVADKGHFRNLLQPNVSPDQQYREVGVGIVSTSNNDLGPNVITQAFGRQEGDNPYILGVVFRDQNGDRFYTPGEGQGNVTIDITSKSTNQTQTLSTWNAGGYQVQVEPGAYTVTAKIGNRVINSQDSWVGDQNVKIDFDMSQPWSQTPPPTPTPPPPPPAPLPTFQFSAPTIQSLTSSAQPILATNPAQDAVLRATIHRPNNNNGGLNAFGFINSWKSFRASRAI